MGEPRARLPLGYKLITFALVLVVAVLVVAVGILGYREIAAIDVVAAPASSPPAPSPPSATNDPAPSAPIEPPPSGPPAPSLAAPAGVEPLPEDLDGAERRTIEIFRAVAPAVVNIENLTVRQDPFRRNVMALPRGTGSGFLWDRAGHVVTNFHVIQGGNAARVTLSDHSAWSATIVGFAADKDIAVLRIEAPASLLTPMEIGRSADLAVGQRVLAIGNPFGLDQTLSTGVISGLGREIMSAAGRPIQGVIQTDAAINPGNSGGPLLDSSGRLIGVNTAIFSPTGASAGIGFAVPADTVRSIVTQIIEHGRVSRPGLGIVVDEGNLAQRAGLRGALVLSVQPRTSAERAGLRPTGRDPSTGAITLGDVIVRMDGDAIADHLDLYRALDRHAVGDEVVLGIVRGRSRLEVRLALQAIVD